MPPEQEAADSEVSLLSSSLPDNTQTAMTTMTSASPRLLGTELAQERLNEISPRQLAHLGDAVFHLFEREREIVYAATAKQMHSRARVNASHQAKLMDLILPELTPPELEIVRRARNLKGIGYRRADQTSYRKATAFEALLGFLYLVDGRRLKHVLQLTIEAAPPASAVLEETADSDP